MESTSRKAPIDLNGEQFRALGHDLVDEIADYLDGLRDRPITTGASPEAIRELLGTRDTMPQVGMDPSRLLVETAHNLFAHSLHIGHPRFLGYITSSAAPIGMLGDLLAASVNANVSAWALSPVASEIEGQTVRWIAELIGYPPTAGGLLVSGGNMANMIGLWAARVAVAGPELRAAGMRGSGASLAVYASDQAHTWLQTATDLNGMGTESIRWIGTDALQRMDTTALREALDKDRARGIRPLMVIATGGSVSTGAVDPLRELSSICREAGAWLHVDGAYGALAAMRDDAPEELKHLALADSVAVDPHKWLYSPLEAGCALVRDPRYLPATFSYRPPYYHLANDATNYLELGPQNSRGFRALKVWLALRQVGREGYERMIGEDIRLASVLHREAAAHPLLEAHTLGLSVATFRFIPEDLRARSHEIEVDRYLNELNQEIHGRLERGGEVFLSNAIIEDRYLLRGCIVNFRTNEADVCAIPEIVARVGVKVHGELSGQTGTTLGSRDRLGR